MKSEEKNGFMLQSTTSKCFDKEILEERNKGAMQWL